MSSLFVTVRRARWYRNQAFLDASDVPADCLNDLRTTENRLSVWHVEDDKSNLSRIITALAANRDDISNLDYLLFDHGIVARLGIKIEKCRGATPDYTANDAWHHDLIELSGKRLIELAVAMFRESERKRIQEREISGSIKGAIARNELDLKKLKPKLASAVGQPTTMKDPSASGLLSRLSASLKNLLKREDRE